MTVNIDPVIFTIGSLPIHWYGLIMGIAVVVGILIFARGLKQRGIKSDHAMTIGGTRLQLTPSQPLTPGTTQRFASSALVPLEETNGLCPFTCERASYPTVQGQVKVMLPAVLKGPGSQAAP